jgi:superfamily II DNA or RNA helicase/HKD family nuclease
MTAKPGVYEALITEVLAREIETAARAGHAVERVAQPLDRLDEALAHHVHVELLRALRDLGPDKRERRFELVASALAAIGVDAGRLDPSGVTGDETLTWIGPRPGGVAVPSPPARPQHGLVHPSLILPGPHEVSLLHEIARELETAEQVDAVVAFLKFSGLRLLRPALTRFFDRGGRFRLVVSTYTGATELRAVVELARLGATVRVADEDETTRLHAKAWHFRRPTGLSTAYIGSSNLSRSALTDGVEWNVRMTEARTPDLLERFATAFAQLWAKCAPDFDAAADTERLGRVLERARGPAGPDRVPFLWIEAEPKPHQARILDALRAERARGHTRNLVVAATGTGKTWVAAFDYAEQARDGHRPRLLFVAHRKEILAQSLAVYRAVLRDPGFGELLVDGARPTVGAHVFASIQSLSARALATLDPDAYEIVVVDEFHHAEAPTYTALLRHLTPRLLLGLTATPERADGKSVLRWFDDRIAFELRLWDALQQDLLAPFHYFGVDDPTSAERAWRRGRLDAGVLDGLYTGDDLRARRILDAVARYVGDPRRMRALGFCVGVGHTQVMARAFEAAGLPAVAVTGEAPSSEREAALRRLKDGELCAVFTVDLFNEGVDVPDVDTVLFLRPTESATIFLQQLGRGLRKAPDKGALTVLDLIGHVHADFRYEARFQAMLGMSRRGVERSLEADFPLLPAGTAIQLEPMAKERVLGSIQRAIRGGWTNLVAALRGLGPSATLAAFLHETGVDLTDVYRPNAGGWTALRRAAGFERRPPTEDEPTRARALGRMLHLDDPLRLDTWRRWLAHAAPPRVDDLDDAGRALARMLLVLVGDRRAKLDNLEAELRTFWRDHAPLRDELAQLLDVLDDRVRHTTRPIAGPAPLRAHATYTRDEIIAAWGLTSNGRLREVREGVAFDEALGVELLFVTLDKSDDAFKPAIRYADYPISPTRFHWETQNRTSASSPSGRRYVDHAAQGVAMHLFVRARRKDERGQTLPYAFLGPVRYVSHESERPMRIVWELEVPMPGWVLEEGAVAV